MALADSCPFVQYKRPLFEIAAQYQTAARKIEETPQPKPRRSD